jgi:hypothetical protein
MSRRSKAALIVISLVGVVIAIQLGAATVPIFLVAVALGTIVALQRYLMRRERFEIRSRAMLTGQEIFDAYYATSGFDRESVLGLWDCVSRCLEVDAGQLRPSDEFGKTIGKQWLTNHVFEPLEWFAADRQRALNIDIDTGALKTVDDFIRTFASKPN